MAKSDPVKVGDWFSNGERLRQVYHISGGGATCLYHEFGTTDDNYAVQSGCSDTALKRWGHYIKEETAIAMIPNLDKRRHQLSERNSEMANRIIPLALNEATDDQLIAEIRRRGLVLEQTDT